MSVYILEDMFEMSGNMNNGKFVFWDNCMLAEFKSDTVRLPGCMACNVFKT